MSRDPAWRDIASAELFAGVIRKSARSGETGRALVVGDPRDEGVAALSATGWRVERWDRFARPGRASTPSPPAGPFDLAAIRLDKSKEVTEMALHLVLGRLRPGGRALLYGAKDEGIRSGAGRVEPITGPWSTRATGGHARVLEFVRPPALEGLRTELTDWRKELPDGTATYPGVFGGLDVDAGTRLLLEHLPEAPRAPVLDFAAGRGVIARALIDSGRAAASDLTLLEPDALAAAVAAEVLPGTRVLLEAGWPEGGSWGTVLSNPPWHDGKRETTEVIDALIRGASGDLVEGGELRLVVQRRLPVERMLRGEFGRVEPVADDGPFRVWSALRD